jgi:GYF domain 2
VDPNLQIACLSSRNGPDEVFWGASFSLLSAIVTCLLAPGRGRSAFWWFLIGGFVPWLSILILYLLADLSVPPTPARADVAGGQPGQPPDERWPSTSDAALALPQDGWFYAMRRRPMGPVSLQYLRGAIEMGSLAKDVPVWCPSFRDWVTPGRVPGFFG